MDSRIVLLLVASQVCLLTVVRCQEEDDRKWCFKCLFQTHLKVLIGALLGIFVLILHPRDTIFIYLFIILNLLTFYARKSLDCLDVQIESNR